MDNIRDRFASRDRMGSDRGGRDRYDRMDRADRGDMGERGGRRSASYDSDGVQIDEIAEIIEQSNSKQLEVFADCIDDVKDEVFASEKEIMKALEQISDGAGRNQHVNEVPAAPQVAIDPAMKEEILAAVFSNTNLLNSIRETLEKKDEKPEAPQAEAPTEGTEEEPKDPLKVALAEFYNNMEDHVHKENVKCYRNVQAALTEQGTQIVDQNKKSLGFLKVFAIVNLVLTVVNIALLACFIFGII